MNKENTTNEGAGRDSCAPDCSASTDYRTSKRLKYATDEWGGRDETHLEIEWNGQTLMVDITDERIHVVGCCFDVDKHSMNAMDITPHVFEQNSQDHHPEPSAKV